MLDLGFIHALKRIVTLLPKDRQTCSSRPRCRRRSRRSPTTFLRDPGQGRRGPGRDDGRARRAERHVRADGPQAGSPRDCPAGSCDRARPRLHAAPSTAPTRSCAALEKAGIAASAIHGNKSQPQRERALAAFRAGTCRVLVATDIAARGIDVDGVTPRHQLRPAERAGILRPPHRPHGPRGRDRASRISFCNDEERAYPARHREADAPEGAGRGACRKGSRRGRGVRPSPHEPSRAAGSSPAPCPRASGPRRAAPCGSERASADRKRQRPAAAPSPQRPGQWPATQRATARAEAASGGDGRQVALARQGQPPRRRRSSRTRRWRRNRPAITRRLGRAEAPKASVMSGLKRRAWRPQ